MEEVEIISKIAGSIGAVLIPVIVVWVGNRLSNVLKEREISVKYIEIAIDVLKEKPEDRDHDLRQWAINILSEYSEIELPKTVQNRLVSEQALPSDRLFETQKSFYDKQFNK